MRKELLALLSLCFLVLFQFMDLSPLNLFAYQSRADDDKVDGTAPAPAERGGISLERATEAGKVVSATPQTPNTESAEERMLNGAIEKNKFVTKKLGEGYPESFLLADMLRNWSPDEPSKIPDKLYQSMRHFDYHSELAEATKYREAEVPFVITNVPAINSAVHKWTWDFLDAKVGQQPGRVEKSTGTKGDGAFGNNHLMFWNGGGANMGRGYVAPTEGDQWTFHKWLQKALAPTTTTDPHYYIHFWGKKTGENPWIYDRLKGAFAKKKSFFVPGPDKNRGVLCR
jgi:hypothetical protein